MAGQLGQMAEHSMERLGAGHPGALDGALPVRDVARAGVGPAAFPHEALYDGLRPPIEESCGRQVGGPGHQGGVGEDVGHPHSYGDPSRDGHLLYVTMQVTLQAHREAGVRSGPHAVASGRPPVFAQIAAQEGIHQLQDCHV